MGSVTFYTQPTLKKSIVHSQLTGATAATYSIYSMLDNKGNLDTLWKPASTGNQVLLIDFYPQEETAYLAGRGKVYPDATGTPPYFTTSGSSGAIDTFGVWLKNYQDFGATVGSVSYRSRLTAAGGNGPDLLGQTWVNSGENGLWYFDLDSVHTQRYAWIFFDDLTEIPEIAHMYFLKKRILQTVDEYPRNINPEYFHDVTNVRGGREYVSMQAENTVINFDQNYTFTSVANKTVLDNVFEDCNGRLLSMVYQPGTAITDAYVVRLNEKKLNITEIDDFYYKAKLKLKTIPYIRSGDNF